MLIADVEPALPYRLGLHLIAARVDAAIDKVGVARVQVRSIGADREAAEGANGRVELGTVRVGRTVPDEGLAVRGEIETLDAAKFVVEDVAVETQLRCRVVHAPFIGIHRLGSHQSALDSVELRENVASAVASPHPKLGCELIVGAGGGRNLVRVGALGGVSTEENGGAVCVRRGVPVGTFYIVVLKASTGIHAELGCRLPLIGHEAGIVRALIILAAQSRAGGHKVVWPGDLRSIGESKIQDRPVVYR